MEKIEVRYKYMATLPKINKKYYHKYIVYTDKNGNEYAARGGPSGPTDHEPTYQDLEDAEKGYIDPSQVDPFGNVHTNVYPYVLDSTDWDAEGDDPSETIIEGDNLSSYWSKIKDAMNQINDGAYDYRPIDQNCNTSADYALETAGLNEATKDGFDDYWAPGSDNYFDHGFFDDTIFTDAGKSIGNVIFDLTHPKESLIDTIKNLFDTAEEAKSPLIIDLDGDGVETIASNTGVHFDLDNNKFAETTGWAGKDDGLLVLDKNNSGTIDNGSELFGNNTALKSGTNAANGFAALTDLDSNADGKIDKSDTAFSQLKIWKDANSNGVTDAGELISLADAHRLDLKN